jgi:hypothetical protein
LYCVELYIYRMILFQNVHFKDMVDRYLSNSFIGGVVDTGVKVIAGVVVTGDKLSPV